MREVLSTLRELHDAIVADFTAHYLGRVATVAAYDPFPIPSAQEQQALVTPAILLELSEIAEGEEDGTDRQALRLMLTAHCVLSMRTAQIQLELREFAADVLAHVRGQRWGLAKAVQASERPSAQPGEFKPGLEGYDSWAATWEQLVYIGPSLWAGGVAPTTIWLGQAPLIGAAHQGDYALIAGSDND